jgi:[acyl-carrier-protein] S-malonyltransferase
MNGRLAILCSGQGGQHPAMFDMLRGDRRAEQRLQQWRLDEKLGAPLEQVLKDDHLLFSNRVAQPLIVAATLANWEAIKHIAPSPSLVAGYSIGELAAYGVAESVSPEDAISLAAARAGMMDGCLEQSSRQTLIAVSGLSAAEVGDLAQAHQFYIAIETAEDSVIVGGLAQDAAGLACDVVQAGGRVTPLAVEIASHTPLMTAAVSPFFDELQRSRFTDPRIPVVSGISAQLVRRKEQAAFALSRQIAQQIKWKDGMDACLEAGITVALELGPCNALSRMLHARHPAIECRSVADFRSFEGVAAWLRRQFEE